MNTTTTTKQSVKSSETRSLPVKTNVKAGPGGGFGCGWCTLTGNHGVRVRTGVKAGA